MDKESSKWKEVILAEINRTANWEFLARITEFPKERVATPVFKVVRCIAAIRAAATVCQSINRRSGKAREV